MHKLSIVVPVFNCSSSLIELSNRVIKVVDSLKVNFEIIFVDDRSPDDAWPVIQLLAQTNKNIKGLRLSKNFGQHAAITAGLSHATGDWIVVMDGDLQDLPEEIPKLFSYVAKGYEVIVARRTNRTDNYFRAIAALVFSKVFAFITGSKLNHRVSNFGIYSHKTITSLLLLNEKKRLFVQDIYWVGYNRIEVAVSHGLRTQGESSYSALKLVSLAFDSIVAHSTHLLKVITLFGFALTFMSLLIGAISLISNLSESHNLSEGFNLIVFLSFASGVNLFSIGIVGIYVGRTFEESRARPLYIIDNYTAEYHPQKQVNES